MSELINKSNNRADLRWTLMASASAAALIASTFGEVLAAQSDTARPQVWIELGAQIEKVTGASDAFSPKFFSEFEPPVQSPAAIENKLPGSLGGEGEIHYQPGGSDWIFSAGVRYGRAGDHKNVHQQSKPQMFHKVIEFYSHGWHCCISGSATGRNVQFADTQSAHQENHFIVDFQAGKDVGLGIFGSASMSVVNMGVRFAQFNSKSLSSVKAKTHLEHYNSYSNFPSYLASYPQLYFPATRFRNYSLTAGSTRNTMLVGPSLSWQASVPIAGNTDAAEIMLDWGVNVAVLFGKQKTKVRHQTSGQQHYAGYNADRPIPSYGYHSLYNHPRVDISRSRSVTVPNIGGMGGFSIKWPNAK
ncbi:MAG TPA: hypothetical protein VG897_11845, partial [Terriglobales bacterium]|nr:hypothetical protein [Terriglobales bacterium]